VRLDCSDLCVLCVVALRGKSAGKEERVGMWRDVEECVRLACSNVCVLCCEVKRGTAHGKKGGTEC
jgi:hypothetical protein